MSELLKNTQSQQTLSQVELLPWARAFNDCRTKANSCLFSMTRTEEREKWFKWAGPIAPARISIIALKGKYKINSVEDLKKLQIGTVRDDVGEQLLKALGVSETTMQATAQLRLNINKLEKGRVDAISYDENVAMYTIKEMGLDVSKFETIHILKESELYFAFHPDFPDEKLKAIQEALDKMSRDGFRQKVLDKYLK